MKQRLETDSLECRQDRQRKRSNLNCTTNNIGENKHGHSQLPPSALVGRTAHIVRMLLVFKQV